MFGHLDSEIVEFSEPVRDIVGEMGEALEGVHCLRHDAGRAWADGGDETGRQAK